MEKDNIQESIKNMLEVLVNSASQLDDDNIFIPVLSGENFIKYSQWLNAGDISSLKDFMFIYNYNLSTFTENMLTQFVPNNNELLFLLSNMDFVENHFKNLIVKAEGHACSADKSSFIIGSLLNYFLHDKEIKVNYQQEYTFHLPKIVFTNHEDILDFFKSLHFLYYGNSEKYLTQLNNILKTINVCKTEEKKPKI